MMIIRGLGAKNIALLLEHQNDFKSPDICCCSQPPQREEPELLEPQDRVVLRPLPSPVSG